MECYSGMQPLKLGFFGHQVDSSVDGVGRVGAGVASAGPKSRA